MSIAGKKTYRVPKHPYRKAVLFGNIVLPSGIDREKYVDYAIRSNTACILTKNGEFIKNCPIVYSFCGVNDGFVYAMDYPQNVEELGAEVVMLNVPVHNKPIIIGFMAKRGGGYDVLKENHLKITRVSQEDGNDSAVSFDMFGLEAVMKLIATSNNGDGGKIEFMATNTSKSGKVIFKTNYWEQNITNDATYTVDGKLDWSIDKTASVKSKGELNIDSDDKIEIGDKTKTEKTLKGETTKKALEDLNDILQAGTVITAVGTGAISPDTIAKLVAWGEGLVSILSDKVKNE